MSMNDVELELKRIRQKRASKNGTVGKNNKFVSKVLISVILLLSSLIFINHSDKNEKLFNKYVLENSFSFGKINNWYSSVFGTDIPFEQAVKENEVAVFNETLGYSNIEDYNNSFKVTLSSSSMIPLLQSGVVVFAGEKEDLGYTVIVQGIDGVDIWYSNISQINYALYDYVQKGEFLSEANGDYLYLTFQKDSEYIGYENYL